MTLAATDRSALVIRAIEATIAGDSSAVGELFATDVVAWSPTASVASLIELSVEIEDPEDAFSEIEVECRPGIDGDRVCVEWVASMLHSGPLNLGGGERVPATHRRITVRGATVAVFTGARMGAVRHYWDEVGLLRDLGALSG
jgi:SnoaL-like polyketide cyclase